MRQSDCCAASGPLSQLLVKIIVISLVHIWLWVRRRACNAQRHLGVSSTSKRIMKAKRKMLLQSLDICQNCFKSPSCNIAITRWRFLMGNWKIIRRPYSPSCGIVQVCFTLSNFLERVCALAVRLDSTCSYCYTYMLLHCLTRNCCRLSHFCPIIEFTADDIQRLEALFWLMKQFLILRCLFLFQVSLYSILKPLIIGLFLHLGVCYPKSHPAGAGLYSI